MSNLLFGILTIAFCAIGYLFSWRYWTKDNYKIAILLLVICGLALRIYTSTDLFLHPWDERYHALVAKNLIQHPFIPTLYDTPIFAYDYKDWSANYVWLHKPPLPLWTMAISMWVFGVNEIALRLPSIILSTIGIWLTFSIGSRLFNKKVGFVAAFFYSINGLIIELASGRIPTDHIDIFFLFFIELAIYFSIVFVQKKKSVFNVLAGISIGAAILSKWLPALIVLPIWLLIVLDSGNFKAKTIVLHAIVLIGTCIAVFLPWQIYIFSMFPMEAGWEASFNYKHITEALEHNSAPFYYFIDRIRIDYGELIYLPLIWFFWKTGKDLKNKKRWAFILWIILPLLFFSCIQTKMPAYILFISPALFLITAEFWFMLEAYQGNHKLKWLIILILLLLIALPVRYTIERIKPFENTDRNPQWVTLLKNLNERNIEKGVIFNYDKPIEAMFYTNLTVYRDIPDKKTIADLIEKGYTVIINDNGKIPVEIITIKGVTLETLLPTAD